MPKNQQLNSVLPSSWMASDTAEMDRDESLCSENACSSPIRTCVISLIFVLVTGAINPSLCTPIYGSQAAVTSGEIGSYQGGQMESPHISKGYDSNKYVAYSILEAYNGIQEEEDVREGETHMRKDATMLIYSVLGFCGVLMLVTSGLSAYVVPLYDQGAAKVLFPMSFAFLSMIGIRYLFRSGNHA